MHGLLRVQGGRANNRESVTTEWEALNEDMAGLQPHIHTPAWNWRVRNHFGLRDDGSWREIALQISEVQPWNSEDHLGTTPIIVASDLYGAGNYPALPLRRTEHAIEPTALWSVRNVGSIASQRLAGLAARRRSTQRKRICLAPARAPSPVSSEDEAT